MDEVVLETIARCDEIYRESKLSGKLDIALKAAVQKYEIYKEQKQKETKCKLENEQKAFRERLKNSRGIKGSDTVPLIS